MAWRRVRVYVRRAVAERGGSECGSAVVEFLGVTILLLVPLVYLILTLGKVQSAVFAGEGAAREAGRVVTRAESLPEGVARARAAVEIAFADQGLEVDGARALSVSCSSDNCGEPGSELLVTVRAAVPLPGVPAGIGGAVPTVIPVEATFVAVVDEFRALS